MGTVLFLKLKKKKNRTVPNLKGAKPFLKTDLKSYDITRKMLLYVIPES
jgi:hypothetical protein